MAGIPMKLSFLPIRWILLMILPFLLQVISGGNLIVHSGAALDGDDVVEVPKEKKSASR